MSLDCLTNAPASLIDDLNKIFKAEHDAEKRVVGVRQQLAAKQLGQGRKSINGLGQPIAEINSYSHAYWNARYPGCWKDKQFVREFLRDNPDARVKSNGTKEIMVGYTGSPTKKFTKKYAA